MPYQNDMMSLADIVGPAYAAQQAGIQNDLANQEQEIRNQVAAGQAPEEIRKPGLANQFTEAQTQNEQGIGMQNQAKGLIDMTAAPSGAQAAVAGNQLKLSQDQVAKLNTVGQMAGQVAGIMDGIPPAARPAAMQRIMQQYQIDPQALGPLASGDPDLLRNVSQKMIQAGAGFQQAMAEQELRNQGSADVARIGSEGRVQSAQLTSQARVQAAEINRQAKQQALNFEQMAAQRYAAGDMKGAEQLRQAAASVRQLAAQTTQTLVGVQPQFGGFDQSSGGGGAPMAPQQPQAPAASPMAGDAVKTAATQAFGSYEPDKYEYGINPATGNFGRRPKGK
jgi:hypothetical protein